MVNVFSECCIWLSCGESGTVVIKHINSLVSPVPQKRQFNFRDENFTSWNFKIIRVFDQVRDEQDVKLVLNKKNRMVFYSLTKKS
jgi:hypothetical protein